MRIFREAKSGQLVDMVRLKWTKRNRRVAGIAPAGTTNEQTGVLHENVIRRMYSRQEVTEHYAILVVVLRTRDCPPTIPNISYV